MPSLDTTTGLTNPPVLSLFFVATLLLLSLGFDEFRKPRDATVVARNHLPSRVTTPSSVRARKYPPQQSPPDLDFPAIYDITLPKSEITSNSFVREWMAELDLLKIKCDVEESGGNGIDGISGNRRRNDEVFPPMMCRLTTLVHSENDVPTVQWRPRHHDDNPQDSFEKTTIHRNQEATSGLWHNRQKKSPTYPSESNRLLSPNDHHQVMDPTTGVDDPTNDETTWTSRHLTDGNDYSRISGFPCMLDYKGTMQWIQDLVDEQQQQQGDHEDDEANVNASSTTIRNDVRLTWTDIGDSYLKTKNLTTGHDIRVLQISGITTTNNNISGSFEKAPFLILTGVHPREYAPPEVVRRWIHWLVTTKTDVKARLLLETTDVFWIPYVNPDGRVLAETSQIYRRKNVNSEASGQQQQDVCRESEYGVDLNRNFPFRYGLDDGSSSSPCSEVFRGSGPASEPEVQAVIRLGEAIFPKSQRVENMDQSFLDQGLPMTYDETTTRGVFLDIHSYGNLYIYVSPSPVVS